MGSVWAGAGVDAGSVGHVVAHGTGTRLGDPVELNALVSVCAGVAGPGCLVTSSKPNFGHALAASGVVSLVGLVESVIMVHIGSLHSLSATLYFPFCY